MNRFDVPIINPFRFVNANAYGAFDPRYNTLPFDFKKDGPNPNGFYPQKWQINDFTAFQFNSDFDDATFKIYNYHTGVLYKDLGISTPAIAIIGVTWKVYECAVNFADWAPGLYYGVLSYTDQNDTIQNIQTSPLDVRVLHPKTLLYEYYHTYNAKGIVWDTGIKMSIRVEGLIRGYKPDSEDQSYIDQEYATYLLNGIPYRSFLNYIGSARGLPDWIVDKMNVIYTVNSLKIDGVDYTKKQGKNFEMNRPQDGPNEDGYVSIEIIPNKNYNLEDYKTGETPNQKYVVVAKQLDYYDNAANIAVAGVFKTHTNLVGVAIWNRGGDAFTLKVGTTNGGSQIGEYAVTSEITSFILINHVFEAATNVYFTGLEGANLDVNIRYDDYDAPQSDPSNGSGGFIPNVEYTYYEFAVGDFVRDWNAATGLGNPDTPFEGCAILDGQNGTINDAYLFRMGFDKTVPALRQTIVGNANNQALITRSELPAEGIAMFTTDVNPTGGSGETITDTSNVARARSGATSRLDYEMCKGAAGNEPTLGISADLGEGNPLDVTPESLVVVRFIKLPA